jgi:tetratricopeptide (TPR) repeat protein
LDTSPASVDLTLGLLLVNLIEENWGRLRRLVGLPARSSLSYDETLTALQDDFSRNNAELEAWSVLYHRYARLEMDLQVQDIAHTLNLSPRQVARRQKLGVRRLVEEISLREAQARAADRLCWLRLKLPAPWYGTLFGAEELLLHLSAMLTDPQPPRAVMLTGPGGIGKTTLAHAAVSRLIESHTVDEVAWLTLDAPAAYPTLLSGLAREMSLLHLADAAPNEIEAGLGLHLSERKSLLVVDHADYLVDLPAGVHRLGALLGDGHLLLTSRQNAPDNVAVRLLPVKELPASAFKEMLRSVARARRVEQARILSPEVLELLHERLGGNPLAGRLVISQLAALPLARILDGLGQISLGEGVGLFDCVFMPAWDSLDQPARETALTFLLLPPDGAFWADVQEKTGFAAEIVDRSLGSLVACSLVETSGLGPKYRMLALTRLFIEAQAREGVLGGAYETMLERSAAALPDEPDSVPVDDMLSLARLGGQALSHLSPAQAGQLVARIAPFMRKSGQWLVWRDALRHLADQMAGHPDSTPADLPRIWLELGVAHRWLGELDRAEGLLNQAIMLFGEMGRFIEQGEALLELGQLYLTTGQMAGAYTALQKAASAAQRYKAGELWCSAVNGLANLALLTGIPHDAVRLLRSLQAYPADEVDAQTLSALGAAYLQTGELDLAAEHQKEALDIFRAEGDLPNQARALLRLGMVYYEMEQVDESMGCLKAALQVMVGLGDAVGQARALTNLGAVYARRQLQQEALQAWVEAIRLQQRLGDEVGMAYTWYNMASFQWQTGSKPESAGSMARARELANRHHLNPLLDAIDMHPLYSTGSPPEHSNNLHR